MNNQSLSLLDHLVCGLLFLGLPYPLKNLSSLKIFQIWGEILF